MASVMKRKRDPQQPQHFNNAEYIEPLAQAIAYLKAKANGDRLSRNDILLYLTMQHASNTHQKTFFTLLKKRDEVTFIPGEHGKDGLYEYKPKIPVRNAEELKAYLLGLPSSVGVRYDELRDGWPNCQPELDVMESQNELLVLRDKKNTIKLIWNNNPTLANQTSDETKHAWIDLKLPTNPDEIRKLLEDKNLKPSSAPRAPKNVITKKAKKKGTNRRGKETNSHVELLELEQLTRFRR